jgi:hypothetical protein
MKWQPGLIQRGKDDAQTLSWKGCHKEAETMADLVDRVVAFDPPLCDPARIEFLERHAQRIGHELTCRAVTHKTIEEDKLALLDVINAVIEIARQCKA